MTAMTSHKPSGDEADNPASVFVRCIGLEQLMGVLAWACFATRHVRSMSDGADGKGYETFPESMEMCSKTMM